MYLIIFVSALKFGRFGNIYNIPNISLTIYKDFLLVSILIIFPWLDFYLLTTQMTISSIKKLFTKESFKSLLQMVIVVSMLAIIVFCLFKLNVTDLFLKYLFITIIAFFVISTLRKIYRDYRLYKGSIKQNYNSRLSIASKFKSFKTEYYRYLFTSFLQANISTLEGSWPDKFSLIGNSKSMILLNQLDEKWLGLDN